MAEKKIGTREYRCDKLPATKASVLFFRLSKLFGPLLSDLRLLNQGTSDEDALGIIGKFLQALDPVEAAKLVKELCEQAQYRTPANTYDPIAGLYDHVFTDCFVDSFKVAAWVVQVNFADFFIELRQSAPTLAATVSVPSAPPS